MTDSNTPFKGVASKMSLKAMRVSMLVFSTAVVTESDSGLEIPSEDSRVTMMQGEDPVDGGRRQILGLHMP